VAESIISTASCLTGIKYAQFSWYANYYSHLWITHNTSRYLRSRVEQIWHIITYQVQSHQNVPSEYRIYSSIQLSVVVACPLSSLGGTVLVLLMAACRVNTPSASWNMVRSRNYKRIHWRIQSGLANNGNNTITFTSSSCGSVTATTIIVSAALTIDPNALYPVQTTCNSGADGNIVFDDGNGIINGNGPFTFD